MKTLVTSELLSDFIECRYRAYLKISGANGQKSDVVNASERLRESYHSQAREHLLRAYHDEGKQVRTDVGLSVVLANRCDLAIDVTATDSTASVRFDALMAAPGNATQSQPDYIPVVFVNNEKVSKEDELRLALCASVLIRWHACRPSFGRILHGSDFRTKKVKLDRALKRADKALEQIRALDERPSEPPPLHLNAHCPTCVFRSGCRAAAIAKDDISLLRGITEKEIVKLRNKGIFTVTQLSYTFRPRRNSKRSNPRTIKYYHALKALALREKRIYVVGKPALTIAGTPVYLDVEGVPDRDFYYLIGLRIPGAAVVQRSLWADDRTDEESIWREFLQIIRNIENPQLLYYGSYETAFLRRLQKRYGAASEEAHSVVQGLMKSAQNILSVVYGRIYFPTYSNGLKDIASYLGYRWSMEEPSGQQSLALRQEWELTGSESAKQALINYNSDDCAAAEAVVKTLLQLTPRDDAAPATVQHPDAVHVDSLKPQTPYRLGPVDFVLPELDQINKCAYWDYQRDRIYVRSNPRLRQLARRNQKTKRRRQILPVNVTVGPSRPQKCPTCASRKIAMNGRHSKLLYDLRFITGGVKRWITKYIIDHCKCRNCGTPFTSDVYEWTRHRYGLQFLAYVIHNVIELHIPQLKLSGSMGKLFGYHLGQPTINGLKRRAAELYQNVYEEIKHTLLHGKLVHADETHLSTKDGTGYVWVFTSMEEVIYLWSATREGAIARRVPRWFPWRSGLRFLFGL
jgi:predicted RecB family nuclease